MHQYHIIPFGRLACDFEGEFGRSWLLWWHFLDGTDDADYVGWPGDVFIS